MLGAAALASTAAAGRYGPAGPPRTAAVQQESRTTGTCHQYCGAGAQTRGDGCVPLLHEAGETSGLGGGAALRNEPEPGVERDTLVLHDRRDQLTILSDDHVLQQSDLASVPLDRVAPEAGKRKRARAVELQLALLKKDERRQDSDLLVADCSRLQRQETVDLVTAQEIEPHRPVSIRIEEQVDRPAELDAV